MAVVDFGGSLSNRPEFHGQPGRTPCGGFGVKGSSVDPNAAFTNHPRHGGVYWPAFVWLFSGNAEADFGARSMLLAVRSLAKNLRTVPGRKMVVLFSGGFPLTQEKPVGAHGDDRRLQQGKCSGLRAGCSRSGGTEPGGSAHRGTTTGKTHAVSNQNPLGKHRHNPHLLLAAYPAMAMPDRSGPVADQVAAVALAAEGREAGVAGPEAQVAVLGVAPEVVVGVALAARVGPAAPVAKAGPAARVGPVARAGPADSHWRGRDARWRWHQQSLC